MLGVEQALNPPGACIRSGLGSRFGGWTGALGDFYRLLGGSMRIGNRLGGSVLCSIVVLATAPWSIGANFAEKVVTVPLGGSISNQSGDRHFGVYIPTRFGG